MCKQECIEDLPNTQCQADRHQVPEVIKASRRCDSSLPRRVHIGGDEGNFVNPDCDVGADQHRAPSYLPVEIRGCRPQSENEAPTPHNSQST